MGSIDTGVASYKEMGERRRARKIFIYKSVTGRLLVSRSTTALCRVASSTDILAPGTVTQKVGKCKLSALPNILLLSIFG